MKLVIKRVTGLGLVALAVLLLFGNAQAQKTLTIGMNELPSLLDPPRDWAIAATWIHMNLFDCLVDDAFYLGVDFTGSLFTVTP